MHNFSTPQWESQEKQTKEKHEHLGSNRNTSRITTGSSKCIYVSQSGAMKGAEIGFEIKIGMSRRSAGRSVHKGPVKDEYLPPVFIAKFLALSITALLKK